MKADLNWTTSLTTGYASHPEQSTSSSDVFAGQRRDRSQVSEGFITAFHRSNGPTSIYSNPKQSTGNPQSSTSSHQVNSSLAYQREADSQTHRQTKMSFRHTVNLGNSIIGVSLLAMPYCFKSCGILLSVLLVLLSGLLNRAGCHLILRSARLARRRNFQHLAYTVFGGFGRTLVELAILGFLLGTCVAFFVVIGDLGPSITAQILQIPNSPHLRAFIMAFLGMFVALPLGLLRRVDSLSSFSMISLCLYVFLIVKLFTEASTNLWQVPDLLDQLNWWDSSHILTTLPIFVMSLSCQPQLFEIFDHQTLLSEDPSTMRRLNLVIRRAVTICSSVYIMVGVLGYLAFYQQPFRGNILLALPPNLTTMLAKTGFILTVVLSLPLCLFPCRTSLHSMLFRQASPGLLQNEPTATSVYMSDRHFRTLTLLLISCTIGISILIPRIELILGLIGSTIGAFVCLIVPALFFLRLSAGGKVSRERNMAHAVAYAGFFVLVACTYSTLSITEPAMPDTISLQKVEMLEKAAQPKQPLDMELANKKLASQLEQPAALSDLAKKPSPLSDQPGKPVIALADVSNKAKSLPEVEKVISKPDAEKKADTNIPAEKKPEANPANPAAAISEPVKASPELSEPSRVLRKGGSLLGRSPGAAGKVSAPTDLKPKGRAAAAVAEQQPQQSPQPQKPQQQQQPQQQPQPQPPQPPKQPQQPPQSAKPSPPALSPLPMPVNQNAS